MTRHDKDDRKDFYVTARLSHADQERLDDFIENEDRSYSWAVRKAVQEFLDRYEKRGR